MVNCTFCENRLQESETDPHNFFLFHNKCISCGEYIISQQVVDGLNEPDLKDKKYIYSGLIREAIENGNYIKFTKDNYLDLLDTTTVVYSGENYHLFRKGVKSGKHAPELVVSFIQNEW